MKNIKFHLDVSKIKPARPTLTNFIGSNVITLVSGYPATV